MAVQYRDRIVTRGLVLYLDSYNATSYSGGGIRIGRRWDDTTNATNLLGAEIPVVKIYNKALDETEITQNYNAIKGRFGL